MLFEMGSSDGFGSGTSFERMALSNLLILEDLPVEGRVTSKN